MAATGGERSIARDEHPMIRAADDGQKKRPQPVTIRDAVKIFAVQNDRLAFDFFCTGRDSISAQEEIFHPQDSASSRLRCDRGVFCIHVERNVRVAGLAVVVAHKNKKP